MRRTYGFFVSLQDWMESARWRERASSFGPVAELYDRVRPPYPPEAVEWALAPLGPARPHRVADVGAGTGIMTRLLVRLGHETVAVEPDEQMRRCLERTTRRVETLAGSAEAIPLASASLDAAIAAQAYHWFDRDRAHAELGRVIRAGGVFAAVWNDRDEACPWVSEYSQIVEGDRGSDGSGADSGRATFPSFGDEFEPSESAEFRHSVTHNADSLVALLKSRSYFLTASRARQVTLENDVRALAATHPDLAGRERFALPYVTTVFRARRR